MYLAKIPVWVQNLFPQVQWRSKSEAVHLTFDDGPIPEVTPWVLDQLKAFGVKATFFCVGENVERYPEIYTRIIAEGHAVGNHTYRHLDGWKVDAKSYLQDIEKCKELVQSSLFRPPYGHLTPKLVAQLHTSGYKIVMWDVLSCDFDTRYTANTCLEIVVQNMKPGSVLVMHDSLKAWPRLEFLLPGVLEWVSKAEYSIQVLEY